MLAQRKIVYEENQERYKQMKVKKSVKSRQEKDADLNNALRSRCIILFVIVVAMAGFFILRSGVAASDAYHLNQLKNQSTKLEAENSRLHLEIAHLKSPERIQSIATNELGMILPDKFFFSTKK
ncbi:cell division protein FtsL [uncultured Megamonas sp.]|uniref:cell division protein FtsL n=1 Tax=uncultured Megamonas sp. TaxID=286140 RepID=UPI0025F28811|nr:cell division protein FtsL [uncultured Megamonas sp.]